MLNRIIRWSLDNRLFVVAAAALLLVYGAWVIIRLPIDVLPDLNRPTVTVMTEAPGLAPEEVETLVTFPIETALNGAPGVVNLRSSSAPGLSIVYIQFDWGSDVFRDRQLVSERLQVAQESLPEGLLPVMTPVASIMGEVLLVGLSARDASVSPMELRTTADWILRPRLLTIPGIAQVTVIGGEVRQFQVQVDPARLRAAGLTLEDVEEAVAGSQANTTGGFLESRDQELLVRNIGRTADLEDLAATVVDYRDGVPVPLSSVADVRVAPPTRRGDAGVNARPGVILAITKQPDADTVPLTRRLEAALAEMESAAPGVEITQLFKQATFIEAAVGNVEEALRDGSILVLIVLALFLANFRTTAITLTAIPLSFIVTALVFRAFDLSINTLTLGGLAVAIGELVDDAIVDVENVFRRLQENRHSPNPRPALEVIYHASSEVRSSIVFATALVVLVFIPLFALSGIEGRLFAPLGIAYIVSIIASLFVSLTVTPALCSYLLPRSKALDREEYGSRFVQRLKAWDARMLGAVLDHPKRLIVPVFLLFLGAVALIPFLGREFLPPFNEGTATINVLTQPGTSLAESNRLATVAERLILSVPEVASTGRRTGRAELDEHAEGVHYSEIDVDFKPSERSRDEVLGEIRSKLAMLPGVFSSVGQPISHRLDHLLSGIRAQIAVKLYGQDLDAIRLKAAEIQAAMAKVPGVVDLQVERQVLIPQLRVRIKREEALRYGVRPGDLAEQLETAFNGKVVGQVLEGQRAFDIVVRYGPDERSSAEAFREALVDTPSGAQVPLSLLADIEESRGPNVIQRENVQRRIVIQSNVADRDLGSVVADVQERIREEVELPSGMFVEYAGQFEAQQQATRRIALLSLFSVAGMFLVLYAHFRSAPIVLQVLVNIPLALIGSVAAVWLTGGTFSVASLVGFITLTGIASRNTIMMISHYLHLMRHEGEVFGKEMVIRGSLERLVPVLMTALTAGLALIPLVLASDQPGKEILYPVAAVILGGLVSSTLLDMMVTPAVFYLYGRKSAEDYVKRQALTPDPSSPNIQFPPLPGRVGGVAGEGLGG
jgi:CzcA family heavy metal efflux pump